MKDFFRQLKENYLSIFSLFIAVVALIHNNLLYEKSERNRNIRTASFEILMKLGELQQTVNTAYFDPTSKFSLIKGWGYIALIGDLSKLIPSPVPQKAEKLIGEWKSHYANIDNNDESLDVISNEIDATREAILNVITNLH